MIKVQYPAYDFRIKEEEGKEMIFDTLRKGWVRLTSEEWVRQNFIQYLVQVKKYPSALIAIEKEIWLGELKKRFDILVYDNSHQPWLMAECKGMEIALTEDVLHQVLRYNIAVPVPYLVITNGSYCAGFGKKDGKLVMLNDLPTPF